MNANCSTCLELLSQNCDLSSLSCGHVFHSDCIIKWIKTGQDNCPQCRSKCTLHQLRRIYFTQEAEVVPSEQVNLMTLQNQLDSLTYQLRSAEIEKKKSQELIEKLMSIILELSSKSQAISSISKPFKVFSKASSRLKVF